MFLPQVKESELICHGAYNKVGFLFAADGWMNQKKRELTQGATASPKAGVVFMVLQHGGLVTGIGPRR